MYFYQARDLLDSTYEENENDIYDTFFDSGHPDGEDWDVLVWYLDVNIANGGSGDAVDERPPRRFTADPRMGLRCYRKRALSEPSRPSPVIILSPSPCAVHPRNFTSRWPAASSRSGRCEVPTMPTLIMMHGMTGDASMMRPFAEKILPDGWTLLVPEARFAHPTRGRHGGDTRILTLMSPGACRCPERN